MEDRLASTTAVAARRIKPMELPEPQVVAARGVLAFGEPQQSPERDEDFIRAVQGEFPTLLARQLLPPGAPPNLARVDLASSSSRLTLSAIQAEFAVEFYGQHRERPPVALTYIKQKMEAVLGGLLSAGAKPAIVGLIATIHYSLGDHEPTAVVGEIIDRHLNGRQDVATTQDVSVRVAVRVADTHYASFGVGNYEVRGLNRPMMPGVPLVVNSWDTSVQDQGIELTVDINNRLTSATRGEVSAVGVDEMAATYGLFERATLGAGPGYVESGIVDLDLLSL